MTTMTAVTGNEKNTYKFTKTCIECGLVFATNVRTAKACSTDCRKSWNNRRATRGAQLYDVLMESRHLRTKDRAEWTNAHRRAVYQLLRAFRDSDNTLRDGRKSWDDDCLEQIPFSYSTEGDKR